MKQLTFTALALALLLPITACSQSDPHVGATDHTAQAATDNAASFSGISGEVQKGIQQAKRDLASKNIDVNNLHVGRGRRASKHVGPSAEITPAGDLLIDGQTIAATPAQHAQLLDYRKQLVGVAEAGMDIGAQGADLGIRATKQALLGALGGQSDKDIEAAIKPQAKKIEAAALLLCKRLPDLLSSQQKLAAAMPEFRPYATMQQKDVDDCARETTDESGKHGAAVVSD